MARILRHKPGGRPIRIAPGASRVLFAEASGTAANTSGAAPVDSAFELDDGTVLADADGTVLLFPLDAA